jgi:hypothetical protein
MRYYNLIFKGCVFECAEERLLSVLQYGLIRCTSDVLRMYRVCYYFPKLVTAFPLTLFVIFGTNLFDLKRIIIFFFLV